MATREDIVNQTNAQRKPIMVDEQATKTTVDEETSPTAPLNEGSAGNTPITVGDNNESENTLGIEVNQGTPALPGNNGNNEDNNAEIGDEEDDPTHPGDYSTDKVKLETGDIIEYLFKDWILEGLAWCLNEAGSIAGAAIYETAYPLGHSLHCAANKTKRKIAQGASNVYHNHINPKHDNLRDLRADHQAAVAELSNDINNAFIADKQNLAMLRQDIGSRKILMEDGKLVDHRTNPPRTLPYNVAEADYNSIRAKADMLHINSMRLALDIDEKDTEKMNELRAYYEQKVSGAPITNRKFDKAFERAHAAYDQACKEVEYKIKVTLLDTQAKLFAEQYSQFIIERDAKNNPLLFSKLKKFKYGKKRFSSSLGRLKEKEYLKAYEMFLQLQQARLSGKEVPSTETLIETVSQMCQQASEGKDTPDAIKKIFDQIKAKKEEPLDLLDAAKADNNARAALTSNIAALDNEIAALTDPSQIELREKLRDRIAKLLERDSEGGRANRQPSPSDKLLHAAIEYNGMLWEHRNIETMRAMYAIGMLSQDAEGFATLAGSDKALMEPDLAGDKLLRRKLDTYKPSDRQLAQFKQEQIESMVKYMEKIDTAHAVDKEALADLYDKFSKPDFKYDDKYKEQYAAFKQARTQFMTNHHIPDKNTIKKIVQRSDPKGQRFTAQKTRR